MSFTNLVLTVVLLEIFFINLTVLALGLLLVLRREILHRIVASLARFAAASPPSEVRSGPEPSSVSSRDVSVPSMISPPAVARVSPIGEPVASRVGPSTDDRRVRAESPASPVKSVSRSAVERISNVAVASPSDSRVTSRAHIPRTNSLPSVTDRSRVQHPDLAPFSLHNARVLDTESTKKVVEHVDVSAAAPPCSAPSSNRAQPLASPFSFHESDSDISGLYDNPPQTPLRTTSLVPKEFTPTPVNSNQLSSHLKLVRELLTKMKHPLGVDISDLNNLMRWVAEVYDVYQQVHHVPGIWPHFHTLLLTILPTSTRSIMENVIKSRKSMFPDLSHFFAAIAQRYGLCDEQGQVLLHRLHSPDLKGIATLNEVTEHLLRFHRLRLLFPNTPNSTFVNLALDSLKSHRGVSYLLANFVYKPESETAIIEVIQHLEKNAHLLAAVTKPPSAGSVNAVQYDSLPPHTPSSQAPMPHPTRGRGRGAWRGRGGHYDQRRDQGRQPSVHPQTEYHPTPPPPSSTTVVPPPVASNTSASSPTAPPNTAPNAVHGAPPPATSAPHQTSGHVAAVPAATSSPVPLIPQPANASQRRSD